MDPLEDDFSNAKLVGPMKSANASEAEIVNHFSGMKVDDLATLEEKPEEKRGDHFNPRHTRSARAAALSGSRTL